MLKVLRRILIVFVALVGVLLLGIGIALAIGFRVHLDAVRTPFEQIASRALGRQVRVDGPLVLVPTLRPTFEVGGLRIANAEGFKAPEFARLGLLRIQIAAYPLLRGRIDVKEVMVDGFSLNLERDARGAPNWSFDRPEAAQETPSPASQEGSRGLVFGALDELSIRDVTLTFEDHAAGERTELRLDDVQGEASPGKPLVLEIRGEFDGERYEIDLSAASLGAMLTASPPWPLTFTAKIAGVTLEVDGVLRELPPSPGTQAGGRARDWVELAIDVSGERLDSLDELLGVSHPPYGPYSIGAKLTASTARRIRADLQVRVGESELSGTLMSDRSGDKPEVSITLEAPTIRLEDFDTGEWQPVGDTDEVEPEKAAPKEPTDGSADDAPVALFSPQALARLDGQLSVDVGEVVSGSDHLGRGRLQVTLHDGRLTLDPLTLDIPSGSLRVTGEFEPTDTSTRAVVTAKIERLDYGVLVRRIKPESDMGGWLTLDVALASRAHGSDPLMSHANGRLDFAVWPENFEAGIIDLWAVNLVASVLPSLGETKPSMVNCLVGLFDVTDGRMSQQRILLDTTEIQVGGSAAVDFETEEVEITLAPTPKKAQLFSLATPVSVKGHFDDFGIGVAPADLLGTVIRVVTGVVTTPVKRLVKGAIPADGEAACLAAMQRPPPGE